jgi:ubiquinone/menaquinone biosynthesis C-methylase UbiE
MNDKDKEHFKKIKENGWNLDYDSWLNKSEYSKQFLVDELTGFGSKGFYTNRIKAIGFDKINGPILDAACGNGQWIAILSDTSKEIVGVDINKESVELAREFVNLNGNNNANIKIIEGDMENIQLPDQYFDGIVCYSAIMYTDFEVTLKGFYRLLKPNGFVYISSDSTGWQVKLLLRSIAKLDFSGILHNAKRIYRKYRNEKRGKTKDVLISKKHFISISKRVGFSIVSIGNEGAIDIEGVNPEKRYQSNVLGFSTILDCLLQKK